MSDTQELLDLITEAHRNTRHAFARWDQAVRDQASDSEDHERQYELAERLADQLIDQAVAAGIDAAAILDALRAASRRT